jgi:plastocyanin
MKLKLTLLTSFVAVALTAVAGDITGKVTLTGNPPPEKDLPINLTDATCGKQHKTVPKTIFYVVGAGKELADVTVHLKGITGKSTGASANPILIDQVACIYTLYIGAVQTGQKIQVKNSDPFLHNVNVQPKAEGNKASNNAQMQNAVNSYTFNNPEMHLKFSCNVHPWMFSFVSVFDHPYFAVTAKDGSFKITGVPDGKYTLVFEHRKAGKVEKEIEVKGGSITQDAALEAK